MNAKQKVEQYIKSDRSLIGGRNLYNQLPGHSLAFQRHLSRQQETPQVIERLCYELCKLVGISERNMKILLQNPVKAEKPTAPKADTTVPTDPNDKLIAFNPETAVYKYALVLAKELELELPSRKKADVFAKLSEARAELLKKK